ncbi:lipopolysaccharide-induced tumor necrosis factor-alpha factor homolog [Ixodes scapularis]|uniref:lipopolysaccharide-induced tumor necrosis factor-alpha factor homolog n=1 Tax=Ixodes scapularis TaxID=6945 RepID=UPI001A9CCB49|nr:lipopolysaccharide-induced tumor necrosis factor-alpha factor homolog [Ixodes scapularis]
MAYYPAPTPTVIVVRQQPALGAGPMRMRCPHCGALVMTETKKECGVCTYVMVGVCCLLCFPCFWVPLVVDTGKDTSHTCPNCRVHLGERRAL